jgi:cysteine desulfurase/selenocysteine lyase
VTQPVVYLNTAACGLIPEAATQAGINLYKNFQTSSSPAAEYWRDVRYAEIKRNVAGFMHAPEKNIAFIPNFSFAINAIVHSLKGNENILLYRNDFPSLYLPFVLNHFNITWIEDESGFGIDMEKIAAAIKEQKIDIVVISHVQWNSGFKIDLKALGDICKEHNALFIADATQSLGAVDIRVEELPVDVLISSNYKWMNAGFGSGLMYMNDTFLAKYPPKTIGNASRTFRPADGGFDFENTVNNYEPGSLDQFGFIIMDHSINEKNRTGMQAIEQHNMQLSQRLVSGLAELPVELIGGDTEINRSAIVSVKEAPGLHPFLLQNNIITTLRSGIIRASIHSHNTGADIDAILSCIRDWSRK